MTIPSFRLDALAAGLIERLEGARPTWAGDPTAATDGLRRIAEEHIDGRIADYVEVMGDDGAPARARRELLETFLPRYTRLALDHNELEQAGYKAWRRGDPVARVLATAAALGGALVLEYIFRHPVILLAFIGALFVPFIPELRRLYFRRGYRSRLQDVVDDMGRIQAQLDLVPAPEAMSTGSGTNNQSEAPRAATARPQNEGQTP